MLRARFDIQEELKKLPEKPGVYIMKDETGKIIYIGKAVVLKNRVRQYFQGSHGLSPKTAAMVSKIREFEYIVTDSELEALILECNLIKKHKPKFNILLRDDKHYPYIKVTLNEEYPRVIMARRQVADGAKYFGPYANVASVRETLSLLRKLFPVRSCSLVFPRDIGRNRPCLYYHMNQCLAPCQGNVDRNEYMGMIKDICNFLGGRQEEVVRRLEDEMKKAAENLEFEKAAAYRDRLNSLRHIGEEQKVLSTSMEDQDVIGYASGSTDTCVQVFLIRNGRLIGRKNFMFEGVGEGDTKEMLASFVKQFYSNADYIPDEILLVEDIEEKEVIEKWLSEKRGKRVRLRVPKRGEKHHLVQMVVENARTELGLFHERLARENETVNEELEELASLLGMESAPGRIEAYDISNMGITDMVASMVVFENGRPARKEYRRFRIRSQTGQNDYGSMQEVLYRRFRRAAGDSEDQKFSKLPDLILVDGGLGHVNAALEVLREFGLDIPVRGMVKDSRHKTRGLVSPEGEIDLKDNLPVLRLVTSIQDEAHRFAVEYNKKLREKRYTKSVLDEIKGIGPKRKKLLLRHFGSVAGIRAAGMDDLLAVEGITRELAERIYRHFNE